ncbi:MAG: hypothetical protein IT379_41545, partial [Deltaproteobacteria bacterium]|nr:hypothetical protein [Deltaproteobacteria bacterium]
MRRLGPRTTVLLVLASSAALLGAMPARAVWLPQLRLEHLRVVVLQRDGAQLMLLAASGASGFALGESRRVTCVVPVPRGARVARGGVGPQAISDALTLVDRLRTTRAQTPRAPELARVAVEQTMLLEGSTAAIDALLRGELRLSGASPPSDDALAFYRQRDWTFLIARAHPSRPPPYTFGPIAVAFRTERPHVPLRMLARRPPLTIDVVLVTALQPVLDRDSLAARGLVYTELVDTPHDAPEGAVPSAPTQD